MRPIEKKKVQDELEHRAHRCEWVADDLRNKENRDYYLGKAEAYREMISFLEPPSPSEDLEKDAMDYYLVDTMNEAHYAEGGQIVPRAINDAYIAGRPAESEQMTQINAHVDEVRWEGGINPIVLSVRLSKKEFAGFVELKIVETIELYVKRIKEDEK